MKRRHTSSGRRKLDYPTSEYTLDEYRSPKKQPDGWRKNIPRQSVYSLEAGRDEAWERRMEGFSDLNQKTQTHNKPKSSFNKRVEPRNLCNFTDDVDTQQDIDDWESSDEDQHLVDTSTVSLQLSEKRQVTKRRRRSAPQPRLRLPITSQESTPSIDLVESPSPTDAQGPPVGQIGGDNSDFAVDSDDFDSPSPVISVARSQSPAPPTQSAVNKSKASDWLRDVKWQRTTPEKSNETDANLEDSAKKKKNKYLKDGLAASLERLINHEKSSTAFWKHKMAQDTDKSTDATKIVTLHIISYHKEGNLITTLAEILAPSGGHSDLAVGDKLTVMFTESVWSEQNIQSGSVVKIYPPWQMLRRPGSGVVLLCTNHCLISGERPLENIQHTADTIETIAHWSCPCSRGEIAQFQDCSAHKNPVTIPVLPSPEKLSKEPPQPTTLSALAPQPSQDLRVVSEARPSPQHTPRSLLESIENVARGPDGRIAFTAVIQRVYRKTNPKYDPALSPSTHNPRHQCSVLVQDMCGFVCELVLSPGVDDRDQWGACLSGVGKVFEFSGITVSQRLTQDKCPKLFSVINSVWRPESVIDKPFTSQDSSQTDDLAPAHPSTFTYTLQATPGESSCNYISDCDGSRVYTPKITHTVADLESLLETGDLKRVDITARVVYQQTEDMSQKAVYLVDDAVPDCCIRLIFTPDCADIKWIPGEYHQIQDVLLHGRLCTLDEYSSVQQSDHTAILPAADRVIQNLPPLVESSKLYGLYRIEGGISGVDEETACSWMVCSFCDSDKLQGGTAQMPFVTCKQCKRSVPEPRDKMNLEVFIDYPTLESVKVKLSQDTIERLLPKQSDDEGYDIQCVLGRKVGPLPALLTLKQSTKRCRSELHLKEVTLPS